MGSKGSRRGPLKTLPIKSYSVQEMAHSSGFGVIVEHARLQWEEARSRELRIGAPFLLFAFASGLLG